MKEGDGHPAGCYIEESGTYRHQRYDIVKGTGKLGTRIMVLG